MYICTVVYEQLPRLGPGWVQVLLLCPVSPQLPHLLTLVSEEIRSKVEGSRRIDIRFGLGFQLDVREFFVPHGYLSERKAFGEAATRFAARNLAGVQTMPRIATSTGPKCR